MKVRFAAFALFGPFMLLARAEAASPTDGSTDVARSACVAALARSDRFAGAPVAVSDGNSIWPHAYRLTPEGIQSTEGTLIWSIDRFHRDGDVSGRVGLQTRHAQLLLISKAFDELGHHPPGEASSSVCRALAACAAFGGLDPCFRR